MYDINVMFSDRDDNKDTISMIRNRLREGDTIETVIDCLPVDMLTEDVVLFAIDNVYVLNKNTPDIIKDNPKYLYAYLRRYYFGATTIVSLLQYGNQSKFDDTLIELMLNGLNDSLLKQVYLKNVKIKNRRLLYECAMYKDIEFNVLLRVVDESLINEEMITFLRTHCWIDLDESLPKFISTSPKYIKLLLVNHTPTQVIEQCLPGAITDEILYMAVKDGYQLTNHSPLHLTSNSKLVEILVKHGTLSQLDHSLHLVQDGILTKKLVNIAIERGYGTNCYTLPKIILNDYDLLYQVIEKSGNTQHVEECNEAILDTKLMQLALDKGYVYNKFTPVFAKNNYHLLKYALNNIDEKQANDNACNVVNYCNPDILDDELMNLAIKKGYYLSYNTPIVISHNRKYVMDIIKNTNLLGLSSVPLNILTVDDISWIIKHYPESLSSYFYRHGYFEYIEKLFKVEYDSKIIDKEKFNKIKDGFGYAITTIYQDHCIFSDPVIKALGIEQACRLFKYTILAGHDINLEPILSRNNIDNLVYSYRVILDKNIKTLDVLSFTSFIDFYTQYENVINALINLHRLDEYRPNLLRLIANNYELNVTSLNELHNINQMIFSENHHFLLDRETSNSFQRIRYSLTCDGFQDRICMLITDHSYSDIKTFLKEIMNSYKARKLYLNTKVPDMKLLLSIYVELLEFLEFITCNIDPLELKRILDILNEYCLNNPDKISILVDNFKDIEKVAKSIYGYEANNKLTKLANLENDPTVTISKNKFTSNNTIAGESLVGRNVDYIELNRESYFFIHYMNFVGTSGKLSDFKHPRLIGKTYICLSAVSSAYSLDNGLYSNSSVNNIILIFDNVDPNSLICMSNRDIYSSALDNDLVISSEASYFDTMKETIENTNSYNEYVFYRENSNGEYIYPSAVLVVGMEPNKYEIDAACYLNVPLVKFNDVNINNSKSTTDNKEVLPYTYDKDLDMLKKVLDEVLDIVASSEFKRFRDTNDCVHERYYDTKSNEGELKKK